MIINYEEWGNESDENQVLIIKELLSKNNHKFLNLNTNKFVSFSTRNYELTTEEANVITGSGTKKNLVRQDKNVLWEDKISNHSEFLDECQKFGIEKFINKRPLDNLN